MPTIPHRVHFPIPSAFAVQNLLYSDGMGEATAPQLFIDRFYFDNFLVMHVLTGTLVVEQYGQVLRIPEGRTVLMTLRDPHKYYFDASSGGKIYWFHFNGSPAEKLMHTMQDAQLLPSVSVVSGIAEEIENLFSHYAPEETKSEFQRAETIYKILLQLTCIHTEALQQLYTTSPSFVRDTERYIRGRIQENLTLDELARHAYISKSRFSELFREAFGTTPLLYIRAQKIELAKRLLLCTSQSICEISSYLHFYDQSYFTNVFRQVTGRTPRQYRIQNTSGYGK